MAKETYDLITAKVKAAELSRKEKKTVYILLITHGENDGDFVLSYAPFVPKHETVHAYKNGSEVPLDEEKIAEPKEKEVKTKKEKVMATKSAKKTAAKKVAAPKSDVKKVAVEKTVAAALKAVQGGQVHYTEKGGTYPAKYLKKMKDQKRVMTFYVVK